MANCRKVGHKTQWLAIKALRKLNNAGLKSYLCPKCKMWHLANSRSNFKVQARIDQLLGIKK